MADNSSSLGAPGSIDDKKTTTQGTNSMIKVKAIYPYRATMDDELTFDRGAIIRVISTTSTDEGWWRGELLENGRSGVFPSNYVQLLQDTISQPSAPPPRPKSMNTSFIEQPSTNGSTRMSSISRGSNDSGHDANVEYGNKKKSSLAGIGLGDANNTASLQEPLLGTDESILTGTNNSYENWSFWICCCFF